jgi:hypothetical protein
VRVFIGNASPHAIAFLLSPATVFCGALYGALVDNIRLPRFLLEFFLGDAQHKAAEEPMFVVNMGCDAQMKQIQAGDHL